MLDASFPEFSARTGLLKTNVQNIAKYRNKQIQIYLLDKEIIFFSMSKNANEDR
jgi:hypothetical protein